MSERYSNWQLAADSDNVLWLYFDKANASTNTFDQQALAELEEIIESLMGETAYRALVIGSKKEKGFIAGADIKAFTTFRDEDEAFEFVRYAQQIFDKLEGLKIPTVAMIDGHCLGGGLELALACQYRVVAESQKRSLGLPEVMLGIHPGWGGSVRLPRLIGLAKALGVILTGIPVTPKAAKRLGFVDVVQPRRHLLAAAKACALGQTVVKRKTHFLSNNALIKKIVIRQARQQLAKKHLTPAHYPAPFSVLNFLGKTSINSQRAYIEEAHSIAKLSMSATTKNLVRLFFLRDRVKKLAKQSDFKAVHVHVIGAGTMGGDIAAWCALKGMIVTLQDREPQYIAPAIKRAVKLCQKKLKKPLAIQPVMDRLIPDQEGRGVASADIIIEAIHEDLDAKQSLFKTLEAQAKPGAILATNTSSIPLETIAEALNEPGRLVGIHFFNPVAKMELVEVIRSAHNDDLITNKVLSFVGQLGKLPVPMKSSPGFLVNRVLMPYMVQALKLYDEGVPAAVIDKIAVDFGMPMGPVTLADMVGLDVCLHVVESLSETLGLVAPERLVNLVEQGKLGVKTGEGFYKYKNGKAIKPNAPHHIKDRADLTDRLMLVMVNEAVACLREGIVSDADLIDIGMIFGTGFAPFTGGPIQYAKSRGINETVTRIRQLNQQYQDYINLDPGWEQI